MFDKTIQYAFNAVAVGVVTIATVAGVAQFVPASTEQAPVQQTQLERVVITAKAVRG